MTTIIDEARFEAPKFAAVGAVIRSLWEEPRFRPRYVQPFCDHCFRNLGSVVYRKKKRERLHRRCYGEKYNVQMER